MDHHRERHRGRGGRLVVVLVATRGVTVPDVLDKTQADATKALEDAGLGR